MPIGSKEFDRILRRMKTNVDLDFVKDDEKSKTAIFSFQEKGFGFGDIVIKQMNNGDIFIDTERMDINHVATLLLKFLQKAILDHGETPLNHKKFNKAMQVRYCACQICNKKQKGTKTNSYNSWKCKGKLEIPDIPCH